MYIYIWLYTLERTAAHCNTLYIWLFTLCALQHIVHMARTHCSTLHDTQRTAVHMALHTVHVALRTQGTAAHSNTLYDDSLKVCGQGMSSVNLPNQQPLFQ